MDAALLAIVVRGLIAPRRWPASSRGSSSACWPAGRAGRASPTRVESAARETDPGGRSSSVSIAKRRRIAGPCRSERFAEALQASADKAITCRCRRIPEGTASRGPRGGVCVYERRRARVGAFRPRTPARVVPRRRRHRPTGARATWRIRSMRISTGFAERDGERQSLFRYFHGRSSLATWLRAVLAQRVVDAVRVERRLESAAGGGGRASRGQPGCLLRGSRSLRDTAR